MKVLSMGPVWPEADRRHIPPLRNQFEAMASGRHAGLLVEPMVERFPFQTPYMPYHPALDSDYLILKSLKGALFFRAQSFRDELAFIRMIRRRNYRTDIEEKYRQFKEFHELLTKKEFNRRLEAELQKIAELFKLRAEHGIEVTRMLKDLAKKRDLKTSEFTEFRKNAYDKRSEMYHRLFWDAVWKNLQKEPGELNVSSLNLQSAFQAMAHADSQSQILRIMKLIKVNRLKSQAEQILEHSSGQALPSELIAAFQIRFHRSTFEKEIRNELSEEHFLAWKNIRKEFIENLGEKYRELKAERQVRADERYRVYWEIYDSLHERIPLNLSLSQTNIQEVYRLFRYRQDGQVHHAFRAIHANRNKLVANQLNEHAERLIPEIASEMNLYFHRFQYEDQKNTMGKAEQFAKVMQWHQEANLSRFWQYRDRRMLRMDEAEMARESYLRAWDHMHQKVFLSASQNSSNLTESLRRALEGSTGRMLRVKGQISLLNGYEPVDPVTTKSRKTHLSFQTGWKEFMDQPPPYVPRAPDPVSRAFDAGGNPSDYYKFMQVVHADYQFHSMWFLRSEQKDLTGNQFHNIQSVQDLSASPDQFRSEWTYRPEEVNKSQESLTPGVTKQSRDEGFSFTGSRVLVPELKNLQKDAAVMSRNKNDARDIELKESERELSSPDPGRYQEVSIEKKKDLKKAELTEVMVRHQESFPLEFRSSYEHQLAFREAPFRKENKPARPYLETVYKAQQGISHMRDIALSSAVAKEAMGTRWKLEERSSPPKKRKLPRS